MDLSSVLDWLKGGSASAAIQPNQTFLAPPRLNYPTSEDVDFARKYDYSYGQPWAPEFEGKSTTLLSDFPRKGTPLTTGTVASDRLNYISTAKPLKDVYAKAALASEGSGLAKLGFDPKSFGALLGYQPNELTLAGQYFPGQDKGWFNANMPDVIAHESIHRGINKLRGSPFWKPEFEEFYKDHSLNNEYLVRHLMETKMGDPEAQRDTWAQGSKDQRNDARMLFNQALGADRRRDLLRQMETAASQYIAAKHPGGPR